MYHWYGKRILVMLLWNENKLYVALIYLVLIKV
jgi:hypothetical protein